MISRVADHCFWLGRYLERAESTARVLSVTESLSLDAELTPEQCWLPVIIVSGEREHFSQKHGELSEIPERVSELVPRYMTWDEDNLVCIDRSIAAARENARSIREVVSLEGWESTNELYLWMAGEGRVMFERDRYGFYRHIRRGVQLVLGLLRSTMLHDAPLDFIWLGVMLERVGQTARVLDVHHHAFTSLVRARREEVVETALWLTLLRACSGFEPFMKRHRGAVTAEAVAAFLLFEADFPRSIRFCLDAASDRFFQHIRPAHQPSLPGAGTAARLSALAAWLRQRAAEPLPTDVHELLTHVVDEAGAIGNLLSSELFYGSAASISPDPADGGYDAAALGISQSQTQTS